MTRAIVIYDSKFGNTEKVARALALGLQEGKVEVECIRYDRVSVERLREYDLLAIGGPTQYGTVSAPLRGFLEKMSKADLKGKKGFAFDTRYADEGAGSAAEAIQESLRGLKMSLLRPPASAIVLGGEGPLKPGEEETFRRIGAELAEKAL